ncbi:hypothetical protein BDQ17DRAFT_1360787 [Cyathus striatus]|nr:hypothetical protein BDQ17DRAFT_1360787 [Cyathus striatus]
MEINHALPASVLSTHIGNLAILPPEPEQQLEVAINIYMVTLGVLIWDMVISVPEDIVLIKRGLKSINISYFLARASALGCLLQSVIAKMLPIAHCRTLEISITSCWIIAIASSSFIFLRRVKSLYKDNKLVYHAFFILYLIEVGVSIVLPIANTRHCVNTSIHQYVATAPFMLLTFNLLVFLAVSYRIIAGDMKSGEKSPWKAWIDGKAFHRLSNAVLQDGQPYYLFILVTSIFISTVIVIPSVPPVYGEALIVPDIVITSTMACRIYRNRNSSTDRTESRLSTIRFCSLGRTTDLTTPRMLSVPAFYTIHDIKGGAC